MTRLVKREGRICPRIETSAAGHTVASPERGLSASFDRKPFIPGSSRPRCSTNRLTSTIRIFNDRGAMDARAQVTDRVPAGVVWMRDGWAGINALTSGSRAVPDAAAKAFRVARQAYEARVEGKPTDG